jgi:hypothetical protein
MHNRVTALSKDVLNFDIFVSFCIGRNILKCTGVLLVTLGYLVC